MSANRAPALEQIQTVLGPISASDLGWTLAHEHFFTKTYDAPGMYLADEEIAALELTEAVQCGTHVDILSSENDNYPPEGHPPPQARPHTCFFPSTRRAPTGYVRYRTTHEW